MGGFAGAGVGPGGGVIVDKGGSAGGWVMQRAWSQGKGNWGWGCWGSAQAGFLEVLGKPRGTGGKGRCVVSLGWEAFALAGFALLGVRTQGMQGFADMGGRCQVQGLTAGHG